MKKNPPIFKAMAGMALSTLLLSTPATQAQTVLSGDHVVEGNLDVGTTNDKGNLKVTGETGNSASPAMEVTGDGGVVFRGTLGTGTLPAIGTGPLFLWYPKKAAFRVVRPDYNYIYEWFDGNIGEESVAFGKDARATEVSSFAMSGGIANGGYSTAMSAGDVGVNAHGSTAMSSGTVKGEASTAMSFGLANGYICAAITYGISSGAYSTAMSFGYAGGDAATAMSGGMADAFSSVAAGEGTYASAFRCVVVGSYNNSSETGDYNSWEPTDPIFVVGNGTGESTDPSHIRESNALVVRKNGNMEIAGKVTMPRQGDILMGEFGEPEP